MRLVLDASAAVRLVMRMSGSQALLDTLDDATLVLAPALFRTEVANALWKYVGAGHLQPEQAQTRLEEAIGLIDQAIPDAELVNEALAAACQQGHPVYDLLYAVLARRHACAVLTLDRKLATLLERMSIGHVSTELPG